jgi:hypothetical protein
MNARNRRPAWWQLWLLFPVLGILAFLDVRVPLSTAGHRIVETGMVLVIFGLVAVWLRINRMAMLSEMPDRLVLHEVSGPASVAQEPGPIAGNNGHGRQLEWAVADKMPEVEPVHRVGQENG